jgi:hypothetical protein
MYPHSYSQASARQTQQATPANNNPNYHQQPSENRKRFTSTEQLMTGFDKFVRRYESRFPSHLTPRN